MKKYPGKKYSIPVSILGLILIGGFIFASGKGDSNLATAYTVERKTVTEVVKAAGTVEPLSDVDLSFAQTGVVSKITVADGDMVSPGEVIATLKNGEFWADVLAARAQKNAALAQLQELQSGTRPEERNIQETRIENSKAVVMQSKQSVLDAIRDALVDTSDAVYNKADQFFNDPRTSSPGLRFASTNVNEIQAGRVQSGELIRKWEDILSDSDVSDAIPSLSAEARDDFLTIKTFLDILAESINRQEPNSRLSRSDIQSQNATMVAASGNVSTALTVLTQRTENLNSALLNLRVSEADLDLLDAGIRSEQIAQQKAVVDSQDAAVKRAEALYEKTILRSPVSGSVSDLTVDVGEIATANEPIVTIISLGTLQVEASVSELDIANIEIGDQAVVTLDAYGDDVTFPAYISMIDPAETLIDDVPTYEVTVVFNESDSRIKPGMTANVSIEISQLSHVIAIPASYIYREENLSYVYLNLDGEIEKRTIRTGVTGADGYTEIIEGLAEGDILVLEGQ